MLSSRNRSRKQFYSFNFYFFLLNNFFVDCDFSYFISWIARFHLLDVKFISCYSLGYENVYSVVYVFRKKKKK